jgi:CspA family cold shock protein
MGVMAVKFEKPERGVVITFDSFKGYGFIRRNQGKDVFFFYDDILDERKDLMIGDSVEFIVRSQPKGPRAYSLHKLDVERSIQQ